MPPAPRCPYTPAIMFDPDDERNAARAQKRTGGSDPRQSRRKAPRKATPEHLANAARYYLERFATSEANLRQVLMRRVLRSARHHGTDAEEGAAVVEDLIVRFRKAGLLNDAVYAEGRARALHRRGASPRKIRLSLRQKGVGDDDIAAALDAVREETGDPALSAAINLARRRRLGPYRADADRAERREKDLAALARAGFGYDTARTVIEAPDVETLEAALDATSR